MKKKRRRDEHLLVRVSGADKGALQELAVRLDVPVSHLVRDAIRKTLREAGNQ